MHHHICLAASLAITLTIAPTLASADPTSQPASNRLSLSVSLGTGGEGELDADQAGSTEGDMDPSYGLSVQYLKPVTPMISVGGLAAVYSYNSEEWAGDDIGRSTAFNLDGAVEAHIQIAPKAEGYAALAVGLLVNSLNEDLRSLVGGADIGTGLGINFQPRVGARYRVRPTVEAFGEVGYVFQSASHKVDGQFVSDDVQASYAQLTFATGLSVRM